jgi:hypothetical protein
MGTRDELVEAVGARYREAHEKKGSDSEGVRSGVGLLPQARGAAFAPRREAGGALGEFGPDLWQAVEGIDPNAVRFDCLAA